MKSIFLSYSRKDEIFARLLAADLSSMGITVWIDVDSIPIGMDWRREVQKGLGFSDLMILVVSPSAIESSHVENERKFFKDHSKPIIPIIHRMPNSLPQEIEETNYLRFEDQSYSAAFSELIRHLSQHGFDLKSLSLERTGILRNEADLAGIHEKMLYAEEISVIVASGVRFFTDNRDTFATRLLQGSIIRVVLLDPTSAAHEGWTNIHSFPVPATREENTFHQSNKDHAVSMEILSSLKKIAPSRLEVKLADFMLPFNLLAANIDNENGRIIIGFYSFRKSSNQRPYVYLNRNSSKDWYEFYQEQFHSIWKSSMVYS